MAQGIIIIIKDQKDFSKEMTFELSYRSWIRANKVNKGRMRLACKGRECTKSVAGRDIKNPRKWKWTQVHESKVRQQREM